MNDLMLSTWTRGQAFLARFARDEKGAALAEYAVIFVVVALVGVGGLTLVGTEIDAAFNGLATWIQTNITAQFGGGGGV